ncbi:MAG: penicillin-binding protein activator LpoB [Alphaproteobacteria bacterium]|nr:penicillin-binding protein activator LpoB [Alphaproteobacteria bacterium]
MSRLINNIISVMKMRRASLVMTPLLALAVIVSLTACEPKTRVLTRNDQTGPTLGLDNADFERAADDAIQTMIRSGRLNKPGGGLFVMTISRITNDTMQRFDTDLLVKKIRVALLNSGKVQVTTAVSANGAEDVMSFEARKLRDSKEFNQATVAGTGKMIAPDISLSGKIIQRDTRVSEKEKRVDYYFQLSVTAVETGLAFYENETQILKAGSAKSVSW